MTNLKSITGGMLWMMVAGILMLATFEPVEQKGAVTAYAAAPAADRAL